MIEKLTFASIGLWLICAVAGRLAAGFGMLRKFPLELVRITNATARRERDTKWP